MVDRNIIIAVILIAVGLFSLNASRLSVIGDNIKLDFDVATVFRGNSLTVLGGWEEGGYPVRGGVLAWRLLDSANAVKAGSLVKTDDQGYFQFVVATVNLALGDHALQVSPDATFTLSQLVLSAKVVVVNDPSKEGKSGGAVVRWDTPDSLKTWLGSPYLWVFLGSMTVALLFLIRSMRNKR